MTTTKTLAGLCERYETLEKGLSVMQHWHESLAIEHGQLCRVRLEVAMKSLFEVFACVRKADKSVIEWHRRSATLKKVVRYIDSDNRIEVEMARKTEELRVKVSEVEIEFDGVSDAVAHGLQDTRNLEIEFIQFSRNLVDGVSRDSVDVYNKLELSRKDIEDQIARQKTESEIARRRVQNAEQAAGEAKGKCEQAALRCVSFAACSVLAAATAVASSGFILAAGAGLTAVSAGGLTVSVWKQFGVLNVKHEDLTADVSGHEVVFKQTESELRTLHECRESRTEDLQKVELILTRIGELRRVVHKHLENLRGTDLSLESLRLKLQEIVRELQECQYEEARRGLAERLEAVVAIIPLVSKKGLGGVKETEIQKAILNLIDIKKMTTEVLRISAKSSVDIIS